MPDAIVERDRQTMVITMNRPQRYNALSGAMLVRMYDAMVEADDDPEIRCIIVTGAGGNFSSGADLHAMAGDAGDGDPEIDVQARTAADPDLPTRASCALPPDEADHRRGRGRGDRGRHRDPAGDRDPHRGRDRRASA